MRNKADAYLALLVEHFGPDRPMDEISRQDAADMKKLVQALPANRKTSPGADPFHGTVTAGDGRGGPLNFGIHRAVGGDHDLPNPGDILCAALAACLDSTLRMIAARMGVPLRSLEISVTAHADVRGCLMVDRSVPAGFRRIEVGVQLEPGEAVDAARVGMLTATAERCCVVLQTLRGAVPVTTTVRAPAEGTAAQ